MAKGKPIEQLKAWRAAAGLTMEAAAARIVIDGKAATRGTWHAWESGRKVPKYEQMIEIQRVTGVDPSVFYERPDPALCRHEFGGDPMQPALL